MDKGFKVVLFHDAGWNGRQGNAHVLKALHGGVEIEVGKVNGHELGTWRGDHTVEEAFGCGDVCGGSADFAGIVDAVAATGEAGAFAFCLFGTDFANNAEIGGFAVGRHGSVANEEEGVSARGHVRKSALCKTADFIGGRLDPFLAVGASNEVFVFKRGSSGRINDGVGSMGCGKKGQIGRQESLLKEEAGLVGRMAGGGKTR